MGLVLRAQPVYHAARFHSGALGVQGDEAFQNFRIGQGGGPAVGGEDRGIEFVVQFFEDGDEALVMDEFFFGGQGGGMEGRPLTPALSRQERENGFQRAGGSGSAEVSGSLTAC